MVIYNRAEAKDVIKQNFELANRFNMAVVNVFHKDVITGEIVLTDVFSHDVFAAIAWRDNYLHSLKDIEVPYVCYVGDQFESASGYLEFEE